MALLRGHLDVYPLGAAGLIFANEVGGALRRSMFRSRVWRPSLVRAGMLGSVAAEGDKFAASWTEEDGLSGREVFATRPAAVKHVAKHQAGGLRFHEYADIFVMPTFRRERWSMGVNLTSSSA